MQSTTYVTYKRICSTAHMENNIELKLQEQFKKKK